MKKSKYNYFINNNGKCVLFNGLTLRLMEFNLSQKEQLQNIINHPDIVDSQFLQIRDTLIKNGFIINNDVDEIKLIEHYKNKNSSNSHYTLTIFPTYECNFSCWYCVQQHKSEFMSDLIIESIKKNITKYVKENSIKILEIHWFGGEPLLCFDKHIKEISEHALKVCNENEATFINNITTNAALINSSMVESMRQLNFKQFQITIDGDRSSHNKTRNHNGEPSFDIILNNVKLIIDAIPEVRMFLRFNFTDKNIHTINNMVAELNEIFPSEYRSKIMLTAVKVWQVDREKIEDDCFEDIYSAFNSSGYKIADVELNTNFLLCDAECKHSYVIFHNGNVDKCNNITPNEAHYQINNDGDIICVKKEPQLLNAFSPTTKCYHCKHLPICLGPCLKCLRNMSISGTFQCIEDISDQNNMERIKNYCSTMLKQNKL